MKVWSGARSVFNTRLGMAVLGGSALAMTSCASDLGYEAPWGTQLQVSPSELQVSAGAVARLQAYVVGLDGSIYNNVRVSVTTSYPGIILVPQTAIKAYSDDDTTWQVGSEHYYELTEVDDQIQSNYLETRTGDNGMADVFVYFRCLPMKCGSYFVDTCSGVSICGEDEPEYLLFTVDFYTATSANSLKVTPGS